jgi:hypothetical protein
VAQTSSATLSSASRKLAVRGDDGGEAETGCIKFEWSC